MKKTILFLSFFLGLTSYSQAGITEMMGGATWRCNSEVGEGEALATATFFEHVIGDKITVRFLKSVSIETEGVQVYSKSYFRPRYVGPEAKDLGDGMIVSIDAAGMDLNYNDRSYRLACDISE